MQNSPVFFDGIAPQDPLEDDPALLTDDELAEEEPDYDEGADDDLLADDLAGTLYYGERNPDDEGMQHLRPRSLDRLLSI